MSYAICESAFPGWFVCRSKQFLNLPLLSPQRSLGANNNGNGLFALRARKLGPSLTSSVSYFDQFGDRAACQRSLVVSSKDITCNEFMGFF